MGGGPLLNRYCDKDGWPLVDKDGRTCVERNARRIKRLKKDVAELQKQVGKFQNKGCCPRRSNQQFAPSHFTASLVAPDDFGSFD